MLNHPSWWDPLIGLVLTEQMPAWRTHYGADRQPGPGPVPVPGTARAASASRPAPRGAASPSCARACRSWLAPSPRSGSRPRASSSIRATGRSASSQGVGHLARRLSHGTIVPLALEYPFWNDRCPEALARFGPPIAISPRTRTLPPDWTARVEQALEATQDPLAEQARRRDPSAFTTLIGGTAGVGGVYDPWRRLRARIRGEAFDPEHRITDAESRPESPCSP